MNFFTRRLLESRGLMSKGEEILYEHNQYPKSVIVILITSFIIYPALIYRLISLNINIESIWLEIYLFYPFYIIVLIGIVIFQIERFYFSNANVYRLKPVLLMIGLRFMSISLKYDNIGLIEKKKRKINIYEKNANPNYKIGQINSFSDLRNELVFTLKFGSKNKNIDRILKLIAEKASLIKHPKLERIFYQD